MTTQLGCWDTGSLFFQNLAFLAVCGHEREFADTFPDPAQWTKAQGMLCPEALGKVKC